MLERYAFVPFVGCDDDSDDDDEDDDDDDDDDALMDCTSSDTLMMLLNSSSAAYLIQSHTQSSIHLHVSVSAKSTIQHMRVPEVDETQIMWRLTVCIQRLVHAWHDILHYHTVYHNSMRTTHYVVNNAHTHIRW